MPEKKKVLNLAERTEFGSRSARRLRRAGHVPVVVYGRGGGELNLQVIEADYMEVVGYAGSSGILNLKIGRKSPITVILKDVQWDILTDRPIHIDFLRVSEDQIVTIPVHVSLENIPEGVRMGGVLEHILHEVLIKVRAKDIPHSIPVDVSALDIGDSIHISEMILPEDVTVDMDPGRVIATVVPPTVAEVEEVEEEELEEGAEVPEGEEQEEDSEPESSPEE